MISVGQIIDLNKTSKNYYHSDNVLEKIKSNKYFVELFKNFCQDNELEFLNSVKDVVNLNLKTYPLFYLSFFLPIIVIFNINEELLVAEFTKNIQETLKNIQHMSMCFSIMFQTCDDFDDYENDKLNSYVGSHLKIFNDKILKKLYYLCRDNFSIFINNLNEIYNFKRVDISKSCIISDNEFSVFVELLDKKIELYDNGKN